MAGTRKSRLKMLPVKYLSDVTSEDVHVLRTTRSQMPVVSSRDNVVMVAYLDFKWVGYQSGSWKPLSDEFGRVFCPRVAEKRIRERAAKRERDRLIINTSVYDDSVSTDEKISADGQVGL